MWTKSSLHDLCELIVDCPHSTPVWTDNGVIVLRNQNIRSGRLDLSTPSFTDEPHYEQRVRRAVPKAGDLVITREAPMGEVCILPESVRCCLGQRMVLLRPDLKKCDGRFLLYALQAPAVQREIMVSEGTGSTVSNLRIPLLEALPILHPELSQQRAIAHILGTLDDKIELNRQMNATLDGIARTLFTSWFVNFDPVRAKAEGRQPDGMDAETAALFPDRLVDSELGLIPEGWEVKTLGDIATLIKSSVRPSQHLDEIFDHYSLPAFDKGQMPVRELGRQIASNKTVVAPDAVLISKLNPHIPRVWLPNLSTDARSICSTEFMVLVPKTGWNREFLYCLLTLPHFQHAFQSRVTGTTGSHQRVTPAGLFSIPVCLPPASIVSRFEVPTKDLLGLAASNRTESATLADLRDTLLPELLSGRVQVQVVEHLAEAVVS